VTTVQNIILWSSVVLGAAVCIHQLERMSEEIKLLNATIAGYEQSTPGAATVTGYRTVWLPAGTVAPSRGPMKLYIVTVEGK